MVQATPCLVSLVFVSQRLKLLNGAQKTRAGYPVDSLRPSIRACSLLIGIGFALAAFEGLGHEIESQACYGQWPVLFDPFH